MLADDWLIAFLLTQVIEVPIYVFIARALPWARRATYAIGASTITHPVIWFCLPWQSAPYVPLLVAAEFFAVGVEGTWGRLWRVPKPWRASLLANMTSLTFGSAIRWWMSNA